MSKHTEGPWNIGQGGQHVYYVNPKIEAGDETIDDPSHDSVIAKCGDLGPWSGIPDEEREARLGKSRFACTGARGNQYRRALGECPCRYRRSHGRVNTE